MAHHLIINLRLLLLFAYSKLPAFILLLFVVYNSSIATDEDDEGVVMSNLLEALTPTPKGWSKNTSFCNWTGITCDDLKRVTAIELRRHSLTGILPSNLSSLSFLMRLDLSFNYFTGPVPSLANLYFLRNLNLGFNNFTSVPDAAFHGLYNLESISLANNFNLPPWTFPTSLILPDDHLFNSVGSISFEATNMEGNLPDIFHYFPKLTFLDLSNNNLTGILPNSLDRTEIEYLYLYNQKQGFQGSIHVLSTMTHLVAVQLQNNKFSGPIPNLSNSRYLTILTLDNNFLTGVVPPSLENLHKLDYLTLDNNMLRGPIPNFVKTVRFSSWHPINRLCPESDGLCDQMILLDIAEAFGNPDQLTNSWKWDNPNCQNWSFIVCTEDGMVVVVNLARQGLTGTISPEFANLTDLKILNLSGNFLTDSIPAYLVTLSQLETLDLSYNNLSGEVPIFPTGVKLNITGNPFLQNYSQRHPTFPFLWVAGTLAITIAGFLMFMVIVYNRKWCASLVTKGLFIKKARTYSDDNVQNFMKRYSSLAPKLYNYKEIKKMTKSFHHKIGQGGFGTVYKGSLDDGRDVAVKVISESKGSGEEFMNEVISISRTSHVNIILLLGFCYEKNKRALIYEFLSNGSLDKFIYRKESPNTNCNLDLNIIYKIAIGIAQGLEYLHRGCSTRIVHLDIKPQNILLDEHFCPKISDFGLAKLCKRRESIVSLLGARGTIGYIAPEVLTRRYGGVSHKSDIYSYGMLILEIIGGRNYEYRKSHSEIFLPEIIYENLVQNNIHSSYCSIVEEEVGMLKKMIMISLWCIQTIPTNRPCITKVIEMLEGPLESVPFPPKPTSYSPNIIAPFQFSEASSSGMYVTNYSIPQQEDVP